MSSTESGQTGKYLYCILKSGDWANMNVDNITGIDGINHLFFVEYKNIYAAVSDVPLSQFGREELDEKLNNTEWLEKAVLKHEYILLQLMQRTAVMPIRFCTIFHNRQGILDLLAESYEGFLETLEFLEHKEEWGVKVYLDMAFLEAKISETGSDLVKMGQEINMVSSGAAFFLKKKRDRLLAERADTESFVYADEFHNKLGRVAERTSLSKLLGEETTGNPKRMILNAAYLISKEQVNEFRREAADIEKAYPCLGLELAVSGPWPAYHFCRDMSQGGDEDE